MTLPRPKRPENQPKVTWAAGNVLKTTGECDRQLEILVALRSAVFGKGLLDEFDRYTERLNELLEARLKLMGRSTT